MYKKITTLLCLLYFLLASAIAQPLKTTPNRQLNLDHPYLLFIEVEASQIRVEMTLKASLLVELLNYPITDKQMIAVQEQDNFKQQAYDFFANRFTLSLDGIPSSYNTKSVSFLKIGDASSVIKEKAADEPIDSAVLGLSFSFAIDQVPEYFQLTLTELPASIRRVPARVQAGERIVHFEFTEYLLSYDWTRQGLEFTRPDIQAVAVARKNWLGKPKLSTKEAQTVLGQLLSNIYQSFEYREESAIYDKLSLSVVGEQLASLYLEQKQRIEAVNRGGARVKILDITMGEVSNINTSKGHFIMAGLWTVSGKVTHFGHTHQRQNQYRAQFTLTAIDNQWKLSNIDILDESRIQ